MKNAAGAKIKKMLNLKVKPGMKETEQEKQSKNITTKSAKASFVPMLPDDHGAYAMLLVPLVIGLVAGALRGISLAVLPGLAFLLLTLALLAAFFAHAPLEVIAKPNVNAAAKQRAKNWLAIYLVVLALCGITLLIVWQRWGLLWLALPAAIPLGVDLISRKWRKQRSLGVRLTGIGGLVLSAPAAYYLATGELDGLSLALWSVNFVYFGSSLFFVRIWFEAKRLEKTAKPGQSLIPGWLLQITLLYHLVGVLMVAGIVGLNLLPWAVFLAFAPLAAKLIMALRHPPTYISIKKIGLFEFAQSFVFALLLIASLL